MELYQKQNGKCKFTGISMDKIDSSKGIIFNWFVPILINETQSLYGTIYKLYKISRLWSKSNHMRIDDNYFYTKLELFD